MKRLVWLSSLIVLLFCDNAKATNYCDAATNQLCWRLETGSGTTATDDSGNGYDGTINNGAVWDNSDVPAGGFSDYSIDFDGVNDNITASNPNLASTSVTAVFWVNLESTSLQGAFLNVGNPASDGFGVGVGSTTFENTGNTGNNLILLFNNRRWISTGDAIGTGWHHIAFILNSIGQPQSFIDAVSNYSDGTGDCYNPSARVDFGGYVDGSYNRYPDFDGDDLGLFSSAYTSTEISDIMNNGLDGTGGGVPAVRTVIIRGGTFGGLIIKP